MRPRSDKSKHNHAVVTPSNPGNVLRYRRPGTTRHALHGHGLVALRQQGANRGSEAASDSVWAVVVRIESQLATNWPTLARTRTRPGALPPAIVAPRRPCSSSAAMNALTPPHRGSWMS
eukprot:scaffold679_cov374-Prasinococcus_capsulatus_cf.AAC.2